MSFEPTHSLQAFSPEVVPTGIYNFVFLKNEFLKGGKIKQKWPAAIP